jgi:hypothetical protein
MNHIRRNSTLTKLMLLTAVCLVLVIAVTKRSTATIGNIGKSDLAGNWQMTLFGNTGCGLNSMLVTYTLNGNGVATNATITSHDINPTQTCPDGAVSTDNTFTITSITNTGSGTAGLSCGAGCGWTFNFQVAPDRSTMNVVDIATTNPNNLLVGSAIHQ